MGYYGSHRKLEYILEAGGSIRRLVEVPEVGGLLQKVVMEV